MGNSPRVGDFDQKEKADANFKKTKKKNKY
jgi:hypothetical protein